MRYKLLAIILLVVIILPLMAEFFTVDPLSWNAGEMLLREKRLTTSKTAIEIENKSLDKTLFMGIRLKENGGLSAGMKKAMDTFELRAAFTEIGQELAEFREDKDLVVDVKEQSPWVGRWASRRFGPDGKIDSGEKQKLWLEFTAPLEISSEFGPKNIVIEICARDKDNTILECKDFSLKLDLKPIPQAILDQMKNNQ
ncbi:MAG: hypothetical protein ACLFSQ_09400 [Candidatus Zixiibacteriota bacterium]